AAEPVVSPAAVQQAALMAAAQTDAPRWASEQRAPADGSAAVWPQPAAAPDAAARQPAVLPAPAVPRPADLLADLSEDSLSDSALTVPPEAKRSAAPPGRTAGCGRRAAAARSPQARMPVRRRPAV